MLMSMLIFFVRHHVGNLVGHLVYLHVAHHVSYHVGHRNVVSALFEGSETLTELKSESVIDLRTCASKKHFLHLFFPLDCLTSTPCENTLNVLEI